MLVSPTILCTILAPGLTTLLREEKEHWLNEQGHNGLSFTILTVASYKCETNLVNVASPITTSGSKITEFPITCFSTGVEIDKLRSARAGAMPIVTKNKYIFLLLRKERNAQDRDACW